MSVRDRLLPPLARALFALPPRVIAVLAGSPPPHAAGLAPDAWLVARIAAYDAIPAGSLPADELRAEFARRVAPLAIDPPPTVRATDVTLAGAAGPLTARLYVPDGAPTGGPLLVYYHGGGWVEGSAATHEPSCRLLAHLSGVRVLSVDYRLAPEHPFPAAADDALAAYRDARARAAELGADPARLGVGGDSAGANLAAVTALAVRGEAGAPAFQLLIYPGLDMSRKRPSRLQFGEGFVLTEENMTWYEDQYVPDHGRRADPRVSPMLERDLSGVAPAHIATALADPLRDDGEEYAARLRDAGVPVAVYRHPQIHGFFSVTAMRSGLPGVTLIAGALRQGLAQRVSAEEHEVRRQQAGALDRPGPEVGRVDDLDVEAGGAQAIGDVRRVEADVVVLEELALAVLRRDDGRVFVRRLAGDVERHHHEAPAARRGDAAQLAHGGGVVGDVLEHVRAHDRVERGVREVERREVELQVDAGRVEVGGHVAQAALARQRREPRAHGPLRREVQQRADAAEQVGARAQQQPLGAVALVGAAAPAQRVRPVPGGLGAGE